MTSHSTAIYTPFADGRTVRDIVEHSPALVTDAWCRQLIRQVLQSLEQQYASGAPHRPITPDSVVMLDSGEALLLPSSESPEGAAAPGIAADLHALALVVHYAISAELPPEGPLGPRLYDDYSDALTHSIDRCLGPNQRLRPKSIAELRAMLGIASDDLVEPAPAQAVTADEPAELVPATAVHAEETVAATLSPLQPAEDTQTASAATATGAAPVPTPTAPVGLDKMPTPRHASRVDAEHGAAPLAPTTARVRPLPEADISARPAPAATPLKPSAHPASDTAPAAAAPKAGTQPPAPRAQGGLEHWAMIAGAAVVLLAAGGALYTHLNQDNSADVVALSLPPQEGAARGLDTGEAVVAPAAHAAPADASAAGAPPAGAADTAGMPAAPVATAAGNPAVAVAGRHADAVVNGTTYKLLIKPWGTVYVNGVDRGVSPPVKRLTLGQGQHTIRIVNPNFAEHVMTVNADGAENAIIEHDFTAPTEQGR